MGIFSGTRPSTVLSPFIVNAVAPRADRDDFHLTLARPITTYPPRPTLDDLDPESATTDALVAMARGHREGEEYPTAETLLGNLPVVLRALCDHVLTGQATALEVAYRIASLIDAVEGRQRTPTPSRQTH